MNSQDFQRRSTQSELMDTKTVSFEEFHECFRQLEFINVCTFAYRPTKKWLLRMCGKIPADHTIFILDAGSGGGDMLRRIWKWSSNNGFKITMIGTDLNPWSKKSAELLTPNDVPVSFETADIFSLNLATQPDFIISSLFTHHLNDEMLVKFILWMDQNAERGWFINDLHRHPVAYYFIKIITQIIPSNRLIRHDAPVSVARAFTRSDWNALLSKAGIVKERIDVTWYFPFRYCVSCEKP